MSELTGGQMHQTDLPIMYHVHGVGPFDFSSLYPDQLKDVDAIARERQAVFVPTIFLRPDYLETFTEVCRRWHELRCAGELTHIAGFGVEGPLLGASGGVPPAGCWMPSAEVWQAIAQLGDRGLSYIVMAPDALSLEDEIEPGFRFLDLVDLFREHGVRLALGHFRHDDPVRSAALTSELIEYLSTSSSSRYQLVTDHLFNDMPRAFVHAWRTTEERQQRPNQLAAVLEHPWQPDTLPEILGPVPATLVQAALDDLLTPMLNFDGHHVDLQICRATIDYLGAQRVIAITDHIETLNMAGETLHSSESGLLLRNDDVVAAGSTGLIAQMQNMRLIGLTDNEIDQLVRVNPQHALRPLKSSDRESSQVST